MVAQPEQIPDWYVVGLTGKGDIQSLLIRNTEQITAVLNRHNPGARATFVHKGGVRKAELGPEEDFYIKIYSSEHTTQVQVEAVLEAVLRQKDRDFPYRLVRAVDVIATQASATEVQKSDLRDAKRDVAAYKEQFDKARNAIVDLQAEVRSWEEMATSYGKSNDEAVERARSLETRCLAAERDRDKERTHVQHCEDRLRRRKARPFKDLLSDYIEGHADIYASIEAPISRIREDFDASVTLENFANAELHERGITESFDQIMASLTLPWEECDTYKKSIDAYNEAKRKIAGFEKVEQDVRAISDKDDDLFRDVSETLRVRRKQCEDIVRAFEAEKLKYGERQGLHDTISIIKTDYNNQQGAVEELKKALEGKELPYFFTLEESQETFKLSVLLPLQARMRGTYLSNMLTQVVLANKTALDHLPEVREIANDDSIGYEWAFDRAQHSLKDVTKFKRSLIKSMRQEEEDFVLAKAGLRLTAVSFGIDDSYSNGAVNGKEKTEL